MDMTAPGLAFAPLDSARVVSTVYSLSLVTLVPFIGAAVAAVAVRRMAAGTRALVWRTAVVMLLLVGAAQLVPAQWQAWVVPAELAGPLVVLGRHAVRSAGAAGADAMLYFAGGMPTGALVVALLGAAYVAGVMTVLSSVVAAMVAARRLVASASPVDDPAWLTAAEEVRRALGMSRAVPLLASSRCHVPMVVGVWRPVVLLPAALLAMTPRDRRAVLLHELSHIRSADVAYALAAQLACALFWFHPGAWWVARSLRRESEMACDDRVLGNGVRQSDYARLLVTVADHLHSALPARAPSVAATFVPTVTGQGALRIRLRAITTMGLDRRAASRSSLALALAGTVTIAVPLGTMKLEPTPDVLQSLMTDVRWESRAYAALRLAPRTDSLAVTQHAATSDVSPHVRAWAAYALSRHASVRLDQHSVPAPTHR